MTFSQLVRQQMKLHRLSIRGVCRRVEIDPSFFAKVLRGERYPPDSEKILRRLAEVLSLEPVRLLLTVGRIPAEWQDRAQDPDVLRALSQLFADGSGSASRQAVVAPRIARSLRVETGSFRPSPVRERHQTIPSEPLPVKTDLTEDLL